MKNLKLFKLIDFTERWYVVCFVFLMVVRQKLSKQKGFLDMELPAVALLGGRPGDGDAAEEDVGRLWKTSPLLDHPGTAVLAWFVLCLEVYIASRINLLWGFRS